MFLLLFLLINRHCHRRHWQCIREKCPLTSRRDVQRYIERERKIKFFSSRFVWSLASRSNVFFFPVFFFSPFQSDAARDRYNRYISQAEEKHGDSVEKSVRNTRSRAYVRVREEPHARTIESLRLRLSFSLSLCLFLFPIVIIVIVNVDKILLILKNAMSYIKTRSRTPRARMRFSCFFSREKREPGVSSTRTRTRTTTDDGRTMTRRARLESRRRKSRVEKRSHAPDRVDGRFALLTGGGLILQMPDFSAIGRILAM